MITLGFSPCPNDTFIFDAMVNGKIDTEGLSFSVVLEDVETLNTMAMRGELDVTKLSYGVLPLVLDKYALLNSGSALGTGVGPLLIANEFIPDITNCTVAIPGEHTTAHLLFKMAYPNVKDKLFMRYDEIENWVLQNRDKSVCGVIIHENRFTYHDKGLVKLVDLGEFWEKETGYPIPLGGIVAKRTLPAELVKKIDGLIRSSIEYAFSLYPLLPGYVKEHSQEMKEEVMRQHIELYVNKYSLDLGEGKLAVEELVKIADHDGTRKYLPSGFLL